MYVSDLLAIHRLLPERLFNLQILSISSFSMIPTDMPTAIGGRIRPHKNGNGPHLVI
jgi:hypothetical protein